MNNFISKKLVSLLFWALALSVGAQIPSPGKLTDQKILILGGIAHVGNGEVIENSAIAVENGLLQFVKNQLIYRIDQAEFDTVIHLNGQHVYPGFIACNTTLGLREIDAVRATLDYDDVGDYNPNIRSAIAFNTDSKITPTVRFNGVLLGQITPRGGIISGSSSAMHFDGWNWEDALISEDEGVHLNWPKRFTQKGGWDKPVTIEKSKNSDDRVDAIYRFFNEAKAYAKAPTGKNKNLRFEAMKGIFNGEKTLYIHCDFAREILQAVEIKRHFDLDKVVIVGGYEAYLIPEVLRDNHVSILLSNLHSLPKREQDPIDLPYQMPSILHNLNIPFAFDMSGSMEAMNTRNLPFTAGTAVAYGLPYEKAIEAITLAPAKMLGIDSMYGTLEAGKSATLFVSYGDALDMSTNQLHFALVNGKFIQLSHPQLDLYKKFQKKYRN